MILAHDIKAYLRKGYIVTSRRKTRYILRKHGSLEENKIFFTFFSVKNITYVYLLLKN